MIAETTPVAWAAPSDFNDWRGGPSAADLAELLGAARDSILALGNPARVIVTDTAGGAEERVPPGWKRAQISMVKDIWNTRSTRQLDAEDAGGIPIITPRFAANYRQLIRPMRGVPGIG